jgi:hypothetical protein
MFKYFVLGAAAFLLLLLVTVKAWGSPTHVFWFSIGACAAWGMALGWAALRPTGAERKHHLWVLGLATLFWWAGEAFGLRLGKYEYVQPFPLTLPKFPWSGTPHGTHDFLKASLNFVLPSWMIVNDSPQKSWAIPFPVIALEAALLFTMFRISHLLFKGTDRPEGTDRPKGTDWRAVLATGGLSAVLLINATAVLDPVVSSTEWCGAFNLDPNLHGLIGFPLWHWFTNESHPGFWFGVPLVNYAAWFLTALVFGSVTRWREDAAKDYDVRAGVVAMLWFFLILIISKLVVDGVLIALPQWRFGKVQTLNGLDNLRVWHLGVVVLLVIGGFALVLRGHGNENPLRGKGNENKWVFWVPQLFVLVFCWSALILEWDQRIVAVGIVSTVFLYVVMFRPGLIARVVRRPVPPAPAPPAPVPPAAAPAAHG